MFYRAKTEPHFQKTLYTEFFRKYRATWKHCIPLRKVLQVVVVYLIIVSTSGPEFAKVKARFGQVGSASKWLWIYRKTLYTEFSENVALFWLRKTFKINQISVFANWNNAKSFEYPIFQIFIFKSILSEIQFFSFSILVLDLIVKLLALTLANSGPEVDTIIELLKVLNNRTRITYFQVFCGCWMIS